MFRIARSPLVAGLMLAALAVHAADGSGLKAPAGESIWPRWQARITVTMSNPLWRQAPTEDLDRGSRRLESLGLLGDYYFGQTLANAVPSGGFRATSGLIFGQASNRALSGGLGASSGGLGLGGASRTGLGTASGSAGYFGSDPANAPGTVPYLGLGYSSGSTRGGWGFTADIGLVAQTPGAVVRLGRVFSGTQTLDDMLREMRLAPLVNLGVSYSF